MIAVSRDVEKSLNLDFGDRVLLHGEYLVPNWYIGAHRVAHWDKFGFPERLPLYFGADGWMLRTAWRK